MTAREPKPGPREWLGSLLSRWADWLLYGAGHDITIRDGDGHEVFSIAIQGGYVARGPGAPYSFECCDFNDFTE